MTDSKRLFKQYWKLGLVAIAVIVLLTIASAMGGDARQAGSSYSLAANGYSAWYRSISENANNSDFKIQRWQKSFPQITRFPTYESGTTLLQIQPQLEQLEITNLQQEWVSQGNTIVILGVTAPATETPFQTDLTSPQGVVRIETTRRFEPGLTRSGSLKDAEIKTILSDRSGSVINQFDIGAGKIIIATTPHLAANAYQEFQPNYQLLTELVTQDRQQILVDEYIHGYVDRDRKSMIDPKTGKVIPNGKIDPITGEVIPGEEDGDGVGDAFGYLLKTPLIVVLLNLLLGTIVLIWQQNRRFGRVIIPKTPEVDNSEAYIQALGGVLRQANSSEFVVQNIGKAEQLSWQQKLGLGRDRLVESQTLITAWENQTKFPTGDLRFVLQLMAGARRLTPAELTLWLAKIQTIDRQLGIRL
jgi:Domain of unknown function (DUF4350)